MWRAGNVTRMEEIHTPVTDEQCARRQGLSLACCAGARLVEVIRPDGSLASRWSRTDNRWIDYPPDTSEAEFRRLLEQMTDGGA